MVFHYMMHVLNLQHQGCVTALGGMPTPFLFVSDYWSGIFGNVYVECMLGGGPVLYSKTCWLPGGSSTALLFFSTIHLACTLTHFDNIDLPENDGGRGWSYSS